MQTHQGITAVREFNEHGYNWYPQVFVKALNVWADVGSVRHQFPQGFKNPDEAIQIAMEHML